MSDPEGAERRGKEKEPKLLVSVEVCVFGAMDPAENRPQLQWPGGLMRAIIHRSKEAEHKHRCVEENTITLQQEEGALAMPILP